MINNWLNIIQEYIIPPSCIFCLSHGDHGMDICQHCRQQIIENNHCCYRCGSIFEETIPTPSLCGHCLSQPPAFDQTYAPYAYQGLIQHLVIGLKFHRQFKNARLLGNLLTQNISRNIITPEVLMPVPLHPSRYKERGFNQAIEIARTVSKQLTIPLDLQTCIRIRDTEHQTQLNAKARRKNLKNAFQTRQTLSARHIAIIDDVMTTGSTSRELANCLKKAGAERIDVWVCARA